MKKTRQVYIAITTIFCFTILFGVFTFKQEAQTNTSNYAEKPTQDEKPTIVKRGQITQKDKEYSKEYRKIYGKTKRKYTFTELINKANSLGKANEEIRLLGLEPEIPGDPDKPKLTPLQYLNKIGCEAEVILLGSVKGKIAHMTDDEMSVFTEYPFLVEKVIKNNRNNSIQINNIIEVTRIGGLIELDGRRIRVEDRTYPFLKENKSYLLFLRLVSGTNGYTVADSNTDFLVEGNSFTAINKFTLPKELWNGNNLMALMNDLTNLSNVNCSEVVK